MIRRAQVADAENIAKIHVDSWRTAYAGQVPEEYLSALSVPTRAEIWRELIEKQPQPVFLCVEDDEIAGFVSSGRSRDEDLASQRAGEIYAIYLKEAYHGRGLGRQLWDAAASFLNEEGFHSVTVWVLETNLSGRRFYEAMGCQLDGTTKAESIGGALLREVRYTRALPI